MFSNLSADKPLAACIFDLKASVGGTAMSPNVNSTGIAESQQEAVTIRFFRRRKFIVNRRLQYRLLAISLSYATFFACSIGVFLFTPLIIQLRSLDPTSADASQSALRFLYLHTNYWPAAIISFSIIAVHSIITSHKVAGPLYRLSLVFNAIKRGWIPKPIQLRKGDYLQAEMEQLNQMIGSLRTRFEEIKTARENLCVELSAWRRDIGNTLREDQRESLKQLELREDILKEKLAGIGIEE